MLKNDFFGLRYTCLKTEDLVRKLSDSFIIANIVRFIIDNSLRWNSVNACRAVLPVPGPILSVFSALIVHSELKSVHPGFPVAFIF